MASREDFEAHFSKPPYSWSMLRYNDGGKRDYVQYHVHCAWLAWTQCNWMHLQAYIHKESEIPPLQWSEEQPPNDECRYNHVTAETPFGRFLITWKGWKENDMPTIDESPWGGFEGFGSDVQDAKRVAEEQYQKRLRDAMGGE